MKVKVKEVFRDKYTNEVYKLNKELEVTNERYQEIKQYVEKVKKNDKKKAD